MMLFEVTWQGQRSLEVKLLYLFWLTFFKFSSNRFASITTKLGSSIGTIKVHNGNLHVMTLFEVTWQGQRSLEVILLVIWRQIVIVMVALFQIAPAWTGSLRLQPNLNHRCTMGTFTLWRTSRSHDKVKCHFRSTSLKLVLIFCLRSFLLWYCYMCNFLTSRVTHVFFA